MNDTVSKIARDFMELAAANPALAAMLKKLNSGKADYLDADRYALELAAVLGKALHLHLGGEKLTGEEYQAVIREALPKGLYSIYEDVADYAQAIQQGINERQKIGLKAVKPKFNQDESDAITDKAASADSYDEIPGGINQDMQHMAQNVATDTMKANAKLAHDVGMEAVVTRIYDGKGLHGGKDVCGFCEDRTGVDVPYSKAIAMDMFRRHPGCGCNISYTVNGKTQVQTDWQVNEWKDVGLQESDPIKNDVYKSYLKNASPGKGHVLFDDDYPDDKEHKRDKETATWLKDTLGGDYHLITEDDNKHNVDCYRVVGGKKVYLEFKRPTTLNAVEDRIRKGTLQLSETDDPQNGILVIDISGRKVDKNKMIRKIHREAEKRSKQKVLDVIIRDGNDVVDIFRVKK